MKNVLAFLNENSRLCVNIPAAYDFLFIGTDYAVTLSREEIAINSTNVIFKKYINTTVYKTGNKENSWKQINFTKLKKRPKIKHISGKIRYQENIVFKINRHFFNSILQENEKVKKPGPNFSYIVQR